MYNPEALYYSENDFSIAASDDLDEIFNEQVFLDAAEEENIFNEEDFEVEELLDDEEIFDSSESELPNLDDDIALAKLSNEINEEISMMSEGEALDYMENRMTEFLPALASALPTIVQLAPQAISAISSLFNKIKSNLSQKSPTGSTTAAPAVSTPIAPTVPTTVAATASTPLSPSVSANITVQEPSKMPVSGTGTDIDPSIIQLLRTFLELIQSPKILELLSGMQSGKTQTITANNGQQINSSNVMGVISSVAGTLAGGANKQSTESFFPEYVMNSEGTFVIDPHNALEEAGLILDLIN